MRVATLNAPRTVMAEYDEMLTWIILALLSIGLVMVYSASIATAEEGKFTGFHPTYYLVRHGMFIFIGLIAGMMAFQVPVQSWQKLAPYLFLFGVALLVLVSDSRHRTFGERQPSLAVAVRH